MKVIFLPRVLIKLILGTLIISGCRSYNIKPNISAQDRFELAKTMFKNKDYFDAKTQFKILTLNNPGINFIDEAQYYLGESHFKLKEYILAADEYSRLIRLYPKSEWNDDAQYKIALCDFKLSPKSALDQKFTIQAVVHFQRFLEDFPNSALVPEAERMLKICRTKLSEKDFKNATLYRKLNDYYAALVYFNSVLENYYDTKYAQPALYWKGECLYKLDRGGEAVEVFKEFQKKYPRSELKPKIRKRVQEIEANLIKIRQTDGKDSLSKRTNK